MGFLKTMYAYLKLLFNVCLFKKGPHEIPHSKQLLRLSTIAYALISYLLILLSSDSLSALFQVATELIITFSFAALILSIANKLQRFVQTTSTLLGTDAIISTFAIPILAILNQDPSNMLAILTMLALMIWNWLVTAHIIRHALNKSFSFALGIAFLYVFSASQIMGILFPISPAS
ncbi:hypothetical protein [Methyloprofundus sedimenti]|nr:hypothetical protein [Methyloprofundus sedimenti]